MRYIVEIKQILSQARQKSYQAVNTAMVEAYWLIGKRIVEEEQNGKYRADYGKEIIKNISDEMTLEFGKGFSERTLREFRQFYLTFPKLIGYQSVIEDDSEQNIWRTPFAKLSWSHFQRVLRISNAMR